MNLPRHRNSVVAIVSSKTGQRQKEGSGLLVAPDLVLTARHVVVHDDAIGVVRLRWFSETDAFSATSGANNNGYHDAVEEDANRGVVWSHEELDLALIRCSAPSDVEPVPMCDSEQADVPQWYAECYPKIGESYWEESVELSGSAGACKGHDTNSRFTLASVNSLKITGRDALLKVNDQVANWSGVSGSSVVVPGKSGCQVIGVVVTENIEFETMLYAVPICEALKVKKVLELVYANKPIDNKKYLTELKKCFSELMHLPQGKILIQKHLMSILPEDIDMKDLGIIVNATVDISYKETLHALLDIFDYLDNNTVTDEAKIKEWVQKMAYIVVTLANGQQICPTVNGFDQRFLEMQCGSKSGVEIGMAAFDRRVPEFRERSKEGVFPSGKYSLESQPEQGAGEVEALLGRDIARLNGVDILHVIQDRYGAEDPEEFLRTKHSRGKPSYYLPCPVKDSISLEEARTLSEKIDFPHVSIATYDTNKAAIKVDAKRFSLLRELLPLRCTKGEN